MEARRLSRSMYDIFFGNQWSDWIRVRQTSQGTHRVAGMRVDHATLKHIDTFLAPNMPITYGQSMEDMLRNNLLINGAQ
jgi:hypothetical protein